MITCGLPVVSAFISLFLVSAPSCSFRKASHPTPSPGDPDKIDFNLHPTLNHRSDMTKIWPVLQASDSSCSGHMIQIIQ